MWCLAIEGSNTLSNHVCFGWNQFSKHKTVFKAQISFQNTNPVLKTQITAQILKISFHIITTFNYKSIKLRSLYRLWVVCLTCHQNLIFVGACLNNSPSRFLFYMVRNVIIVAGTVVLVLQCFMWLYLILFIDLSSLMWPDCYFFLYKK